MKKVLLTLMISLSGFSVFSQNTIRILNTYFLMKDALLSADGKVVSQTVNTFYQSLKSEENFPQKTELLKATEKLYKAGSLENQRTAFKDVSVELWALVKKSNSINQVVYYQYCPMKKAYWLSKEKEIKNPYYGSSMLTCGKVVETKK